MSLERQADRLLGLLSWARVVVSAALAGKLGKIQTSAHHDDEFDHWQPYGLQSRPLPGADALIAAMGSHSDQRVAFMVGDRRYTAEMVGGEVRIYDDLGQYVWLKRTGIVAKAPSIKLGENATLAAARATDPVGPDAGFTLWMTQVSGYINGVVPGTVTPAVPTTLGTITSGSAVTKVE